jgi:succinate dehydrogenase / fumarate reductase iron-sulfur subunit
MMVAKRAQLQSSVAGLDQPLKTVTFRVFRYDPERDTRPRFREYRLPVYRFTTVLDGLLDIKFELDPTLAVRYSCRMGSCGSCGMVVNGKEMLACKTIVLDLNSDVVTVMPLNNMRLVRDLVVDFDDFFAKHRAVKPYLIREDLEAHNDREFLQRPEELLDITMFANCIKCGLCYSACPTTATDRLFLGPQALATAYRYLADSRDAGARLRLEAIDGEHGLWRCHFAGTCSYVCPKGVDPAFAIQQLKAALLFRSRHYIRRRPAPESSKPREVLRELALPPPDEWPSTP